MASLYLANTCAWFGWRSHVSFAGTTTGLIATRARRNDFGVEVGLTGVEQEGRLELVAVGRQYLRSALDHTAA